VSCWFVPELDAAAIGGRTSQKGIIAGRGIPNPRPIEKSYTRLFLSEPRNVGLGRTFRGRKLVPRGPLGLLAKQVVHSKIPTVR
jgi:hypothetical protein